MDKLLTCQCLQDVCCTKRAAVDLAVALWVGLHSFECLATSQCYSESSGAECCGKWLAAISRLWGVFAVDFIVVCLKIPLSQRATNSYYCCCFYL